MVNNLTLQMITERLGAVGHTHTADTDRLAAFVDLMAKWNRKINLTALSLDPLTTDSIDRLIVEPVVASGFVTKPDARVLDLGSGGGSPAIPFRIQLPSASMRMVESRSKKCAFLREAARSLDLANTSVEESRFELLFDRPDLKHSAEIITIRAVRLDAELVDLIRFLLVPDGQIFRFASQSESQVPAGIGLRTISVHPLVPSHLSQLQILVVS